MHGLLVACGGAQDSGTPIERDPCAPLGIAMTAPSEIQAHGVADAIALWRAQGLTGFDRAGDTTTIELRFEQAAPAFHGYYDPSSGVVYINLDVVDPQPLAIVIAHELGHAFGLVHVDPNERRSLMNAGNLVTTPTDEDRHAIEALWGNCE